jgi:hypothetical protein
MRVYKSCNLQVVASDLSFAKTLLNVLIYTLVFCLKNNNFFCNFFVSHVKLLIVFFLFNIYIYILVANVNSQFGDFGLSSQSNQVNKLSCDAFKKIKNKNKKLLQRAALKTKGLASQTYLKVRFEQLTTKLI